MRCKKCRKNIPDGSKFCNHCGKPTSEKKMYRRSDGLYEKILTIDGKRVAFRGKTEKEVFLKITEYEAKKEAGEPFEVIADLWEQEHCDGVSPTSWNQCYEFILKEIREYFKGQHIREITPKDVNTYMKQLPKTYAHKTCSNRLSVLNMIFKFAISENMCDENPCAYITVPKGHGSKKRRAPTSDEIDAIKKNIGIEYKGFSVGFLAVFLLYTGCRKDEALALTYGDIDRDNKRLKITKSVYYVGNDPRLKCPKTEAGTREIIIPDFLFDILPCGNKSDYLFCRNKGELMKNDFFDKAWKSWIEQTEIDLTAHQLRHGYATILHEADIDVKDAQGLLGHADITTTQNIYTEISHKRKDLVARKFNEYLQ